MFELHALYDPSTAKQGNNKPSSNIYCRLTKSNSQTIPALVSLVQMKITKLKLKLLSHKVKMLV